MKTLRLITCVASAFTILASADELPRGVFKTSELEAAIQQATEKKQPLIFVYTEYPSNCGLCNSATADSFKAFRSRGTLVYLNSKSEDLKKAPKEVFKLRLEPSIGNTIPMVMVTTSDGSKAIKGYSYKQLTDGQAGTAARDLRRVLDEMNAAGDPAEASAATAPSAPALLAPEQAWQNTEGKTITAAVKEVNKTHVTFIMPGGKSVSFPLDKLADASREKLSSLAD